MVIKVGNSFYGTKKVNIDQPNYIIAYPDKMAISRALSFGANRQKLPDYSYKRNIEIDKIIPTAENLLGVPTNGEENIIGIRLFGINNRF